MGSIFPVDLTYMKLVWVKSYPHTGAMEMQQLFMFKTEFSNGRPNFSELIFADNVADADRLAVAICQGISDEYSCDPDVEVEILGPRAVDLEYIT